MNKKHKVIYDSRYDSKNGKWQMSQPEDEKEKKFELSNNPFENLFRAAREGERKKKK